MTIYMVVGDAGDYSGSETLIGLFRDESDAYTLARESYDKKHTKAISPSLDSVYEAVWIIENNFDGEVDLARGRAIIEWKHGGEVVKNRTGKGVYV